MKKVVHIITRLDMGGSAQNTLLTCTGLADKYEQMLVHGISHESHMTKREQESVQHSVERGKRKGVRFIVIPSLVRSINPIQDICAFWMMVRLLVRERPDIVHTHTSKAGLLGRWAAKLAGIPVIVHTPHGHVFYGHFGLFMSKLFLLLEKMTAPITDRVIALTQGERDDHINLSVFDSHKMLTIHSGVETNQYKPRRVSEKEKQRVLGIDVKGLVVGTVGWLLPIKGPMHLLEAMAAVWEAMPDVTLVFAGKGDLETELKASAFRMGVTGKVRFLGWRDEIPQVMRSLDIFVLPSLNEGMGRVLVEAMAAGKPVVGTRVGGIPDLIKDGENGFLVAPGDVNGLSQAIQLLTKNEQLRKRMGKHGRILAQEFGLDKMIEKIDALYASL
jgi:glycosyltransferase involved in cell wall biosynthesis